MADDTHVAIDRFTGYFEKQVAELRALTTEHQELYRKLLYVSVLDALARSVVPKRGNRDRFTYLLKRFCRWPDGERVSLPHLVELLRRNPDPAFEKLRLWAAEKDKKLPVHGGSLMPISHDPTFDEVKTVWPTSQEHRTPLEGIDLTALQHFRLLWVYRNMLVHEMRTPGRGMEFGNDSDEPFYHGMSTVDKNGRFTGRSTELVYPWRFLHRLCDTALGELRGYFAANDLNPYESFVFGTYWIEELNR
jgi:hypothetical protein